MRRLLTLVALLLAMSLGAPITTAQDASPVATPGAASCDAPDLPPGTPTPMEEMAPGGTPAPGMAGMDMSSPEAMAEAASPAAETLPEGTPADQATTDRVTAAVQNVVGCLNAGDALGFAALITPNYLINAFGTTNPYDLPMFLDGFPQQELQAVDNVQTHDDGRVSADVTTVLGGTQVDRFRAFFVDDGDYLLLDDEPTLPLEGADVDVRVTMLDYAFEMSQTSVPADSLISFELVNAGEYPHEFAVVRLPDGVTVDQVLEDPALEEQIQFLGGAFAEPGETGHFGLQGLEPGTYTAVCFVDVPEGVPHVVRGMVTEFEVTE